MPVCVMVHCKVTGPEKGCRAFLHEVLDVQVKSEWGYMWDLPFGEYHQATYGRRLPSDEYGLYDERVIGLTIMSRANVEFRFAYPHMFPVHLFGGLAILYPTLHFDVVYAHEEPEICGAGFFNPPEGEVRFRFFKDAHRETLDRIGAAFGIVLGGIEDHDWSVAPGEMSIEEWRREGELDDHN